MKLIDRCKDEITAWTKLQYETKNRRIALQDQLEKKRKLDKDPDMSSAEDWMREALVLADEVLEAGEGELVGMGDFGDVEFMVCPLSSTFSLFNNCESPRLAKEVHSSAIQTAT